MVINCNHYHQCQKRTPITNMLAKRTSNQNKILKLDLQNIKEEEVKKYEKLNVIKNSEVKKHLLKIIVSQNLEPENILKIFLNFTNFEPHYSYEIFFL